MIQIRDRRILIDGKPSLILAGEIHPFRLERADWNDRIAKTKALGCYALAAYLPWLVYEPREGDFRLKDVEDFIDAVHAQGLMFIARPGPYVMAEMKNEGIPFWVYEKHPDAVPVAWEGEKHRSRTLDYLHSGYLEDVRRWYGAIMPILAKRLHSTGGPVIGVQLDNEIGMLQWVNNQPDLSDGALCDFAGWLGTRYSREELRARYPFDIEDPMPRAKSFRNPQSAFAAAMHRDYGDYQRNRFARYIGRLREFAEENGVKGIPFIVNIHGSGGGRGLSFPIGIHQLMESYTYSEGLISGSDHYLGELTRENAADLYVMNAFMEAVHRPEQPLTSMEFEVGSGDYGETGAVRQSGASADFKARLSVAQGNRLLNYYLLAGGVNPPLLDKVGDGNDRVAFTGERHGFAAPISPEGALDPTYHALRLTTAALNAVGDKLADADEERDDLALAFVPDYYKTDFRRPGPMEEIVRGLERAREPLDGLSRALVLMGYRFTATDIQRRDPSTRTLAFACSRYLDRAVQERLAAFVSNGGSLLLVGELPTLDMEGRPCTVLAEALGAAPGRVLESSGHYHLSVQGMGWAEDQPEVRVGRAQIYTLSGPTPFLKVVGTDEVCGFEASVGRGRAIVLGCSNYPSHLVLLRRLMLRLGTPPGLQHDDPYAGLVTTTVRTKAGDRFLTILNLDHEHKVVTLREKGRDVLAGPLSLPGRESRLLPLSARFGTVEIEASTAEVAEVRPGELHLRAAVTPAVLRVRGQVEVVGGKREGDVVTFSGAGPWVLRGEVH